MLTLFAVAALSGCGEAEELAPEDRTAVSRALGQIGVIWGRESVRRDQYECGPVRAPIMREARDGVETLLRVAARDGDALFRTEATSGTPMREVVAVEADIVGTCLERVESPGDGWREAYADLRAAGSPASR